jgi:plastocyanin
MRRAIPLAVFTFAAVASSVRAQSACVTPNCLFGDSPQICKNTAAARIPLVLLTTSGVNFVFNPAEPRIEPGDCITWRASGVTHSSTAAPCTDDPTCGAIAPPACTFESGNLGNLQSTTCHYDEAQFPISSASNYYCRIHASPTAGTMRGTLRVTTPIVLTVQKNVGTGSIDLSWTGGGVIGDVSYKVAKQTVGDPKFPAATTTTVNPNGGVLGTAFTDAGELSSATTRYYLVRNKQTNEP